MNLSAPVDINIRPASNRDRERITALVFNVLAEYGYRVISNQPTLMK